MGRAQPQYRRRKVKDKGKGKGIVVIVVMVVIVVWVGVRRGVSLVVWAEGTAMAMHAAAPALPHV